MKIKLNGEEIQTAQNLLIGLLREYKIDTKSIVVAINTNIVKKEKWDSHFLKENDVIECLTFMGGG